MLLFVPCPPVQAASRHPHYLRRMRACQPSKAAIYTQPTRLPLGLPRRDGDFQGHLANDLVAVRVILGPVEGVVGDDQVVEGGVPRSAA